MDNLSYELDFEERGRILERDTTMLDKNFVNGNVEAPNLLTFAMANGHKLKDSNATFAVSVLNFMMEDLKSKEGGLPPALSAFSAEWQEMCKKLLG